MMKTRNVTTWIPAWIVVVLVLLGAVAAAAEEPDGATGSDGWLEEVREWREERLERLTRDDGWLTLAGLEWLEPGEGTVGSAPESDVVLPAKEPPHEVPGTLGVVRLGDDGATFAPAGGVTVTVDGEEHRGGEVPLATDVEGEPTVVEHGPVIFYLIERQGRVGVRIKDREHPALRDFAGIEHYPLEAAFRVEAEYEPYDPPKSIAVPTVLGTPTEQPSPGAVVFRMAGRSHRIDALEGGDGTLFLVFGDATNGEETYGGGRFLYTEAPEDGRVVVDFNRAYNPPCAFTPYATCPLPPPQNRLPLAVRAGEKKYGDGGH